MFFVSDNPAICAKNLAEGEVICFMTIVITDTCQSVILKIGVVVEREW